MLKLLLKKQLMEIFRSYYYNQRKNKTRSRAGTILMFVFFIAVMVVMLGGIFAFLGYTLCQPLVDAGVGWLYFIVFGMISIVLGVFGSVFSTFSGLYLAKDNDLLLSMPIPVGSIIASRLLNVYLMGLMYSAVALIPGIIIYWIYGNLNAAVVIGGILLLLLISVFVLLLSCLLGWVVAKLSLRLRNKSFVSVLLALGGIAIYYVVYFRATLLVQDLIRNAAVYGGEIRAGAYLVYLFGRIGEGDWLAMLVFTAIVAVLTALTWLLLRKTFLKIATATGAQKKTVYKEKSVRQSSADAALLKKELKRFTSSANVMLNAGLGILFMAAGGVALLIYGKQFVPLIDGVFGSGTAALILCALLCMMNSMVDLSAASVSLEGKSLWIPKSLPVSPMQVLKSKLNAQLLLSGVPMLFVGICAVIALEDPLYVRLLMFAVVLLCTIWMALWGQLWNLKLPVLNWTSEVHVVKQSGSVALALFGNWAYVFLMAGLYLLVGRKLGAAPYLGICALITGLFDLFLFLWIRKRGTKIFAAL